MSYIMTEKGLSIVIEGMPRLITPAHPKWDEIAADPEGAADILNPTRRFVVGQTWTTRAGSRAVITAVDPLTGTVSAEIDECYEIDTYLGRVNAEAKLDDDLVVKEHLT